MTGRGKGRANRGFYRVKHGTQGAAKETKRRAARQARLRYSQENQDVPLPLGEKELRQAIAVAYYRQYPGALRTQWPTIIAALAKQFRTRTRTVKCVLTKLEKKVSPEERRPGAGRKSRITPGTDKADRLVGGLLSGFGARHTANFVNQVGVSPGKKPLHRTTVLRVAKSKFGLVVGKRLTTKTGSRDPNSSWAKSRFAICLQFRADITNRTALLEQTLFCDEHTEFCVFGKNAHAGQSNRHEWRAHRDEDGNICLPEDGGVLDDPVPQPKAKNPARADGLFGVCATIPVGGRRREGRRMKPYRYRGKVVGMATYERGLAAEIERVREKGLENRRRIADPNTNSRPGVWHDHCDAENPYEVSPRRALCPSFLYRSQLFIVSSLVSAQTGNRISRRSSR